MEMLFRADGIALTDVSSFACSVTQTYNISEDSRMFCRFVHIEYKYFCNCHHQSDPPCLQLQKYKLEITEVQDIYAVKQIETVPVAPVIRGVTFAFIFHMHCISIMRSLYLYILKSSQLLS